VRDLLHHKIINNEHQPNAPWMVFIHGAGGNQSTWSQQVRVFRKSYNLLLIDLRDHGKSQSILPEANRYTFDLIADDVIYLLEEIGVQQAVFVSLSMGSLILQKLSMKRPDLIRAAIMAGGVFHVSSGMMLVIHLVNLLHWIIPYPWMYKMFSWVVMPRKHHQAARRIYIEQSKLLSQKAYLRWVSLYKEFKSMLKESFFYPVKYPTLVAMGGEDYVFLRAAKRYASKQPMVNLEVFPGCGHICNIEQASTFNTSVSQFLNSHQIIYSESA
jgi:pimeloyl-ACP methyl ester carboxylesterase